jgi:hypothetical protein
MPQASTVRGNEQHFRIMLKPLSGSMNVWVFGEVEMDISTNETLPIHCYKQRYPCNLENIVCCTFGVSNDQ